MRRRRRPHDILEVRIRDRHGLARVVPVETEVVEQRRTVASRDDLQAERMFARSQVRQQVTVTHPWRRERRQSHDVRTVHEDVDGRLAVAVKPRGQQERKLVAAGRRQRKRRFNGRLVLQDQHGHAVGCRLRDQLRATARIVAPVLDDIDHPLPSRPPSHGCANGELVIGGTFRTVPLEVPRDGEDAAQRVRGHLRLIFLNESNDGPVLDGKRRAIRHGSERQNAVRSSADVLARGHRAGSPVGDGDNRLRRD